MAQIKILEDEDEDENVNCMLNVVFRISFDISIQNNRFFLTFEKSCKQIRKNSKKIDPGR